MKTNAVSGTNEASRSHTAELLYRIGFGCHGFVHMIIGYLALTLALGEGGRTTGPKGALQTIGNQPFGKFMLLLLGLGLLGFVAWRAAQALGKIDNTETGWKAIAKRAGAAASGIIYLSFAFFALRAFATGVSSGDQESSLTARVLEMPAGRFILMVVGLIVIATGIQQIIKGFKEKFLREFDTRAMKAEEKKVLRLAGKIGLPARGIVLSIIGYLLVQTGIEHQAQAAGTKGALEKLLSEPYGTTILAIVATGLIAYAIYCFIATRYRHFVGNPSR